jgi:hypothetical protein
MVVGIPIGRTERIADLRSQERFVGAGQLVHRLVFGSGRRGRRTWWRWSRYSVRPRGLSWRRRRRILRPKHCDGREGHYSE